MEIETKFGEYVRTESGYIGKVITKRGGYGLWYELDINKEIQDNIENGWVHENKIVNHSKDIIDLIEVGDFVNGQKIKLIIEKGQIVPGCYSLETDDRDTTAVRRILFVDEIGKEYIIKIKSILTHEQYERNCYRLEKI